MKFCKRLIRVGILGLLLQNIGNALPPVVDMYGSSEDANPSLSIATTKKRNELIPALEARVQQLTKRVDELTLLINPIQHMARRLQIVEEKLSRATLQTSNLQTQAVSPLSVQKTQTVNPIPKATLPGLQPSRSHMDWRAAVNLLKKKNYTAAKPAFEKFLKQHTTHPNHANAQYFLAQLLLLQGSPDLAMEQFKAFLKKKPRDSRVPDAEFQIGLCYYAKADNNTAIAIFKQLRQRYPNSQAAKAAYGQLQRLKVDVI